MKIDTVSAEMLKNLSEGVHDVAFKDDIHEYWILYSVGTGDFMLIPFGKIAYDVINTGLSLQPDNTNCQKNKENYIKQGMSPLFVHFVQNDAVKCRKGLMDLKERLLKMPNKRKTLSALEYSAFAMNTLYTYSSLYDFRYWDSHCSDINPNDFDGFPMTSAYRACEKFNEYTANRCIESVPVLMLIDGEAVTGRVFVLDSRYGEGCLFPADLQYLIQTGVLHECVRCGQLYMRKNASSRYCPECVQIVGKKGIASERRRKNEARYLHKRILDKLGRIDGISPEGFRLESNYYWAVVNGKTPAAVPEFASDDIKSEAQYIEWLQAIMINPFNYLNKRYDVIDKQP